MLKLVTWSNVLYGCQKLYKVFLNLKNKEKNYLLKN